MCSQEYLLYTCGCKPKGQFIQCDEKYDSGLNLRCDKITAVTKECANYCASHLVSESKAAKPLPRSREPKTP